MKRHYNRAPVGVRLSHRSICRGNTASYLSSISSSSATHCTHSDAHSTIFTAVTWGHFFAFVLICLQLHCQRAPQCSVRLLTFALELCVYLRESVHVIQSIGEAEEGFFLSCASLPSLIRTYSVNQAWIPNTITCKVLCLGVIGLARALFLKRLVSLGFPQTAARSPVQEMQLVGRGWRDGEGKKGIKTRKERFKRARWICEKEPLSSLVH